MSNPYVITEQAINELRERSTEKLKKLFPQGVSQEILKRINREESALRTNPNIYSLLIVDDVIKTLRRHKFSATVIGDWFSSYHAWLLDLTEYNPIDIQLCYRDMGLCAKQFIRDDCVSSPIEIYLSPEYGKSMCVDLTSMYAHKYDFWVSEHPRKTDSFMLINECYRADDIYANYAPIIKIVVG